MKQGWDLCEFDEDVHLKHDPPKYFDWREKVGKNIKNQGRCGSCWGFGMTEVLEIQYKVQFGKFDEAVDFSEQEFLDCSNWQWGNLGCLGGRPEAGYTTMLNSNMEPLH